MVHHRPAYTFVSRRPNRPVSQYSSKYRSRYTVYERDYRPLPVRPTPSDIRLKRQQAARRQQEDYQRNLIQRERRRYGYDPYNQSHPSSAQTNAMVLKFARSRQAALDRRASLATQRAQQHYQETKKKQLLAAKHAAAKVRLAATKRRQRNLIAKQKSVYNVYPSKKKYNYHMNMTCDGCGNKVKNCDC